MPHTKETDLSPIIVQLRDKTSPKRRSAAKKLRKLATPAACPALLEALQIELRDQRTWETQYQMVMALGMSGCKEALPLLKELSHRRMDATMILVGVGDALVRLGREYANDPRTVLDVLGTDNDPGLADGALRAVAMLRLHFESDVVENIIHHVTALNKEYLYIWLAAACAGWTGNSVKSFLETCLSSRIEELRQIAEASLAGKYLSFNPA